MTTVFAQNETKSDTSHIYKLTLEDGSVLNGEIITRTDTEVLFMDYYAGKLTILTAKIKKEEMISGDAFYIITMNNGSVFKGKIVNRTETDIELKTETLGILYLKTYNIITLQAADEKYLKKGKYWFPNPNATRYFFAPSAITLEKGEGYYQNVYVLANTANFGLTDNVTLGGGVVLPFAYYITPKFGKEVYKNVHLGGGVLYSLLPSFEDESGFTHLGIAYGLATYGTIEHNATIGVGYGFSHTSAEGYKSMDKPIITINGMTRVSRRVSIVTENWMIKYTIDESEDYIDEFGNEYTIEKERPEYKPTFSLGIRVMGDKVTVDIASVVNKEFVRIFPIGLPYIDLVVKF